MEVNFNRRTIISFPNNDLLPDIETGIADGSLYVDEVLFKDKFTIGECNANQFECELYDYPMLGKGEKIYVYQIVDEVEGEEPINVPIFTGYVDSCTTNRGRLVDSKNVVAYDALQFYGDKNVARWWAGCFSESVNVSVKYLRDSLFEFLGIPCEDVTLPNDSVRVTHTQKLNKISFSAVLNYIMLVNGANAKTDRSGVVHFIVISQNEPIEIDTVYAQNTSEFDTYEIPSYAGVRITNSTKGISVLAGSVLSEQNIFDITDNLLLLKQSESSLYAIAENILNVISGVKYKPAQIDMIYSQLNIKVGDIVKIDDNEYLVCENQLSGSMLVDQHISSTGANAFEEASNTYDATQAEIQQELSSSGLKYYRFTNKEAIRAHNNIQKQIMSIRYTVSEATIVTFNGVVILDIDVLDESQPGIVEVQYMVNGEFEETFKPTETYFYYADTQKHTLNLIHFWEHTAIDSDYLKVFITCKNCTTLIGAYKEEAIMSGMGLVGETIWDGWIEAIDRIGESLFKHEPYRVDAFDDETDVTINDNITITVSDDIDVADIANEPDNADTFSDAPYLNKVRLNTLTWQEVLDMGTWQNVLDEANW